LSAREAREGKVDRKGERIRQSERIIADGGQIEFSMAVELNEARGSRLEALQGSCMRTLPSIARIL